MVSPAMLKGMNTEVYGEGHPFGDPSWYQAYNTPYYKDSHKQFRKLMREYVDEHIMSNVHDWDEKGVIPKEMP
ncbi:apdG, partial [Symbiodinium pilosum]